MWAKGRKTLIWEQARKELKIEFQQRGIVNCELGYEGCWKDNALGFLHIKKRRHLKSDELKLVVLGCNICHEKLERLPESKMAEILLQIIENRK